MHGSTRRRILGTAIGFTVAFPLLRPGPVQATNHLWQLSELYSNGGGTVQFIEMHNDFDVEGFLSGTRITSTNAAGTVTNTFTFPAHLPDLFGTADKFVLIATAGFGSQPGGVTPDYTLPAGFLFTGGGTVTFNASGDSMAYAALPTDGTMSLTRDLDTHAAAPAVNSPTNFAGATGSVPEPGAVLLALGTAAALAPRRRR